MTQPSTPSIHQPPRPAAPTPAERARTIAARICPSTVLASLGRIGHDSPRSHPPLHLVHANGCVSVLLPDTDPLVERARSAERGEIAVLLELADLAPVELREPVRGLLWITGWLRPLEGVVARARAISVAETRPDERLLEVGHGATLLNLNPASLVLADAEGTHSLRPEDFRAAEPDPFHHSEHGWLRHLDADHADVVRQLDRHLPAELRGGELRPLGLDQYGLRLRVQAGAGDHDVRLGFRRPVRDAEQLKAEMRRLVGCPFLAGERAGEPAGEH